jgi:hypothetical protein
LSAENNQASSGARHADVERIQTTLFALRDIDLDHYI